MERAGLDRQGYPKKYSDTKILEYDGINTRLAYTVDLEIVNKYMHPPFLVNAEYRRTERIDSSVTREIIVFAKIGLSFSDYSFNDFYMMSVNAIRHELEHYNDDINENLSSPQYSPEGLSSDDINIAFQSMAQYLLDKAEQIPFIKGFMLSSKKQNLPVSEQLKNFVHDQLFSNNKRREEQIRKIVGETMAEHVERQIIDLYLKRTQELFPNMK